MTENFYRTYTPDYRTYAGELTVFDFGGKHTIETMTYKIMDAYRFDRRCKLNVENREKRINKERMNNQVWKN